MKRAQDRIKRTLAARTAARIAGLIAAVAVAGVALAAPRLPATAAIVAAPSDQKAYVAMPDENEVAVVATRTHQVLGYIPGILGPHDLVASADGHRVYVGNSSVPVVSVIDTSTDTIVASIRVGFDQRGLALSPDGRDLLVSLGSVIQEVVRIDTTTLQIRGRLAVSEPGRLAVSPDGRLAYVISAPPDAAALVVIDLATLTRTAAIRLDSPPATLNFAPDGTRLYLTMADTRTILTLDPARKKIVGRITVRPGSRHSVPAEDGRSFLVITSTAGAGTLDVVDVQRGIVSATVTVGTAPAWVAADQHTHTAYVTNEHSGDVSFVDLDTRTVAATIAVGHGAGEIVLAPAAAPARR